MRKKTHRLGLEEVHERSKSVGMTFIGPYLGYQQKTLFRCSEGHEVMRTPAHVFRGYICPRCNGTERLTKEEVNERIISTGIVMIGEYRGAQTKTEFKCPNGHIWSTMPHAIYYQKKGCSICNTGTFSSDIPAYAYVLDFGDFIKYGITANLTRRMEQHESNGEFTIVKTKLFEHGIQAAEWESNIKRTHGGRYVTKERCPDGYTETLSKTFLDTILQTL